MINFVFWCISTPEKPRHAECFDHKSFEDIINNLKQCLSPMSFFAYFRLFPRFFCTSQFCHTLRMSGYLAGPTGRSWDIPVLDGSLAKSLDSVTSTRCGSMFVFAVPCQLSICRNFQRDHSQTLTVRHDLWLLLVNHNWHLQIFLSCTLFEPQLRGSLFDYS